MIENYNNKYLMVYNSLKVMHNILIYNSLILFSFLLHVFALNLLLLKRYEDIFGQKKVATSTNSSDLKLIPYQFFYIRDN